MRRKKLDLYRVEVKGCEQNKIAGLDKSD